MTLDEILHRLRPINYQMIRHIVENTIDPHGQTKMAREFLIEEITFAFTQVCEHRPSNIVSAHATGDMSYRASGSFCRACGQKVKPIVRVVGWELEDQIPSPPSAA